jgi:hypothetical protein
MVEIEAFEAEHIKLVWLYEWGSRAIELLVPGRLGAEEMCRETLDERLRPDVWLDSSPLRSG